MRARGALVAFACLALLGALALSAPAAAQLYISNDLSGNTTQNYNLGASGDATIHASQPITTPTGSEAIPIGGVAVYIPSVGRATTSSIDIVLYDSVANSNFGATLTDPIEAFENMFVPTFPSGLTYDSVRRPTGARITFNKPSSLRSGINIFPAPENSTLQPGTTYHVFVGVRNLQIGFRHTAFSDDMDVEYCSDGSFIETTQGMLDWKLGYFLSERPSPPNFVEATATLNDLNGGAGGHQRRTLVAEIFGHLNDNPEGSGGLEITEPESLFVPGRTLTAGTDTIMEANGLPSAGATFTYQWVRFDPFDEGFTEVTVGTGPTYDLVPEDRGLSIRLTVRYIDAHCYENVRQQVKAIPLNTPAANRPTISGTAQVTRTLEADRRPITDADGLPSAEADFTYQWERVDANTGATSPIGTDSPMYTLVEADRDQRVRVTVSFTDNALYDEAQTSDPYPAPPAVIDPKPNVDATGLVVTGVYQVSRTLTANTDGITDGNGPTTPIPEARFSYRWERASGYDGRDAAGAANIPGATSRTYALVEDDQDQWVRVTVTFTDDDRYPETLQSTWTQVRQEPNVAAAGLAVTGTHQVGETITANTNVVTDANGPPSPIPAGRFTTYRWERASAYDGSTATGARDIPGASQNTYTLVEADQNQFVRVTVTFQDADGNNEAPSSPWRMVMAEDNTPATGLAVIGTPQVGQSLLANTDPIRDGNGLNRPVTYTYQWERASAYDGSAATGVAPIEGATEVAYVLVEDDQNQWVRVTVMFQDADGNTEMPGSDWTRVAPEENVPATGLDVTGDYKVDATLTAETTGIEDENGRTRASFTYLWERANAVDGRNAQSVGTAAAYTLVEADQGRYVRVTVRFNDDDGNSEALESDWTPVAPEDNVRATGLAITGRAQGGRTLVADTTAITDPNGRTRAVFSYQWSRVDADGTSNAEDIGGAILQTYRLSSPDVEKRVRVTVRFTDDDGYPETVTSPNTAVVERPDNSTPTGEPVITGSPQVGKTLLADVTGVDDLDGLTTSVFAYQWSRVDADGSSNLEVIEGATEQTYTLQSAEQGKRVRVRVNFDDDQGTSETITSQNSDVIEPEGDIPARGHPIITGTVRVGSLLRADTSSIRDVNGLTRVVYRYQWSRVDAGGGANMAPIAGATALTYTPVAADYGKRLRVTVRFQDDDGNPEQTLTSPDSSVVLLSEAHQRARDEAVTEEWLKRFGNMVSAQALDAIEMRLETGYAPQQGAQATLAGYRFRGGGGDGAFGAAPLGASRGASGSGAAFTGGGAAFTGGAAGGASGTSAGQRVHPFFDVLGSISGLGSPGVDASGLREHTFAAMYADAPTVAVQDAPLAGPAADAPFAGMPELSEGAGGSSALRGSGGAHYSGGRGRSLSLTLPDLRSMLGASSFVLGGMSGEGAPSVWGRGAHTTFEARQGALKVDGDVVTGQFGTDRSSGPWLLGLSAAYSYGSGDFSGDGAGEVEANMTGFYPYLGYRSEGGPTAWATLGYGDGNMVLKPEYRAEVETDVSLVMGSAGVRGRVIRPDTPSGVELSLRADASFVRTTSDAVDERLLPSTSNNANRVRFGLSGSRNITWEDGATLTPSVELGVLYDGGDLDAGTGADLEAGLRYAGIRGLSFDLRARSLVAHRASGTREWGVSGELRYDPAPASERGLALALNSGYGGRSAGGGMDDIFKLGLDDDSPAFMERPGRALPGARIETELGYGLSLLGGRYTGTPWARLGISEGLPEWRLGWRITPFGAWAPELRTGVEFGGSRRGRSGHDIRLKLDTRF